MKRILSALVAGGMAMSCGEPSADKRPGSTEPTEQKLSVSELRALQCRKEVMDVVLATDSAAISAHISWSRQAAMDMLAKGEEDCARYGVSLIFPPLTKKLPLKKYLSVDGQYVFQYQYQSH